MARWLALTALLLLPLGARADAGVAAGALDLPVFNDERVRLNEQGMQVLLGWAVLNLAAGTSGYFVARDARTRFFFQMDAGWGLINGAIAALGWWGLAHEHPHALELSASLQAAQSLERILLLNVGLDVAYAAFSGFLWERGLRTDSSRLVGYGQSVLLQGTFLFAFDLSLFLINHGHDARLWAF